MTTTLQDALLKAGLITADKLKKAEADKKKAAYVARHPQPPPRPVTPPPPRKEASPAQRPQPQKQQPPRAPQRPQPSAGFIEGKHHHHMRTNCDVCGKSSPDVEYYEHKNRSLEQKWLCVRCADQYSISDEFRQTMQSQHAQSRMFRREYGKTKIFK